MVLHMKLSLKEYRKKYYKSYFHSKRLEALEKLGGRCENPYCGHPGGMDELECLIIVGIRGYNKPMSNYAMYKDIINNPERYRLLCSNCKLLEESRRTAVEDKPAGKVAPKEPLKRDVKEEDEEYVEQDEEWVDEEFTLDLDIVVENLMDNYLAGDSKGVGKKLDEFVSDGQIKAGQKAEVMKRLKKAKVKLV